MTFQQLVQAGLGAFDLRLTHRNAGVSWDLFFSALKARGFAPRHIIDVGANHGSWTRGTLMYFPDSYYTLIEPQDWLKKDVQDLLSRPDGKIRWIGAGAGDKAGTLPFTIAHRDDSSTFTAMLRTAEPADVRRIDIPVVTLNEVVRTGSAPFPELVKIDAEGFDLKVVAGASDLLGKTDIFLLETALVEQNVENTLENVVVTMSRAGYHVVDITAVNHGKYGVAWLCDLAFLRKDSPLMHGISYE